MKFNRLHLLVSSVFLLASCHLRRSPDEGYIKNGEYNEPLINWRTRLPAGYKMSGMEEFKKEAMSESFGQLEKENGSIPFARIKDRSDFRKDHFNFFSVTLFTFDSTEKEWRTANHETKIRNYLGFENYGNKLDSTITRTVLINGKKMLIYEFIIEPGNNHPALHQRFYSCFVKKYDVNFALCSDNIVDDKDMVTAIHNSDWTERME